LKTQLQGLIGEALTRLKADGQLPAGVDPAIQIERARDPAHGDLACNVAMLLARAARRKPRELAEAIVGALPDSALIQRAEVAGPGFINVFLSPTAYHGVIGQILDEAEGFGRSDVGAGQRVQVEFVSANPTGPLHVGHGRGAAYGATLANLLAATGFQVQREYYVNDAGRQMSILAVSVWLRYLARLGVAIPFPANGYRGAYVHDIAERLQRQHGEALRVSETELTRDLPPDAPEGDKEVFIDALIRRSRELLGVVNYRAVFQAGLEAILDDLRDDLAGFGVVYDQWFSEQSLMDNGTVEAAIARLQAAGHLYEKDGALWFRSTAWDDEKDRVVRRENGQTTYFASDIAYHMHKFERGFDRVINIWGADHHGYIKRVKAALAALGRDPEALEIQLVQFANLYRGGERMSMSTRAGEFVTLRQLREEVGDDAARFFYVLRRSEQHLEFDLDLAKSQTKDNPVYYIQYAHARICSVLERLAASGAADFHRERGLAHLGLLVEDHEQALFQELSRYPEVLAGAALAREPHQLAHYLRDLANAFHTYYNEHRVLVDDLALRDARLALSVAVRQVIRNGLQLLGVSAPEAM